MQLPPWLKILYWLILFAVLTIFLVKRFPIVTTGTPTPFDALLLLIWLALALAPIFQEVNLFGIKLKQEIQTLRAQLTRQVANLQSEIRTSVRTQLTLYQPVVSGTQDIEQLSEPSSELDQTTIEPPSRSLLEYQILNTLWTKQVNRFPDYSGLWSFRINVLAPVYLDVRRAATKLIAEGLISETEQGQYYLTRDGFEYCKKHYHDFPSVQWWPEEKINKEKLKLALEEDKPSPPVGA